MKLIDCTVGQRVELAKSLATDLPEGRRAFITSIDESSLPVTLTIHMGAAEILEDFPVHPSEIRAVADDNALAGEAIAA